MIPHDFPFALYTRLNVLVSADEKLVRKADGGLTKVYRAYAGAHNAILWRFRGMVDADEAYRAAYARPDIAGDIEKRYMEERELFGFLASFVSAVEILCYCSYAIAAMIEPLRFQLKNESDRRKVSPSLTDQMFKTHFRKEAVTPKITKMLAGYRRVDEMRNKLSHRGSPPRKIFRGDGRDRTEWEAFEIDLNTTFRLRSELAPPFEAVIGSLCQFAESRLRVI